MEVHMSDLDVRWLRKLGELFKADPQGWHRAEDVAESMGLPLDICKPVLLHLDSLGFFHRAEGTSTTFMMFRIAPKILQAERQLETAASESSKADRVEKATSWFRSNPWTAYPFLALIALTALVALVNQLLDLLEKFGLVHLNK
jgi:hypothetical protein